MAKVYAMIADGTEEVECLMVVDLLKRARIETVLVAPGDERRVVTSHGLRIEADQTAAETDFSDADLIFVPGGMPGSEHLSACKPLIEGLERANREGRRIAAICAAPGVVLGRHGFLEGKRATCYPGFEEEMRGARATGEGVVTDGNITTARGLGVALELGLELITLLTDEKTAETVAKQIQYR
ncbi:MAG: DJ-1/PfpI family protein [Clostridiales bacterium]|nr:DJ-1/PfpI family protein [Clostridiales bacterium]